METCIDTLNRLVDSHTSTQQLCDSEQLGKQCSHVWKYKELNAHHQTHTLTHTCTMYLNSLRAHLKMVIYLIAQAVDLCTHISEVPSCLSVFLPPGAERCKFMSAAAPNSLGLNILSLCYSLHLRHSSLLGRVQEALTSSARRYQLATALLLLLLLLLLL